MSMSCFSRTRSLLRSHFDTLPIQSQVDSVEISELGTGFRDDWERVVVVVDADVGVTKRRRIHVGGSCSIACKALERL